MEVYNALCRDILQNGVKEFNERTGKFTLRTFARHLKFDLQKEFPLVTSKKTAWDKAYIELLWYLKGSGDVKFLQDNGIQIWNDWVIPGTTQLGPVYGVQWRHWKKFEIQEATSCKYTGEPGGLMWEGARIEETEIDQIAELIHKVKNRPSDRRMIVSAWNVSDLGNMQLPPCHMTFQVTVIGGKVNLHLLQRSVDVPVGLPWNWVCYAMLTHMIAHVCDLEVGEFAWTGVDCHIYEDQIPQVEKFLQLDVPDHTSVKVVINEAVKNIDDFDLGDVCLTNVVTNPFFRIPVAV